LARGDNSAAKARRARLSAAAGPALVLAIFYLLAAAAAFQGFYAQWTMMDGSVGQALPAMLDGRALRPFVYRQLLPAAANAVDRQIPAGAKAAIEQHLVHARGALQLKGGVDAARPNYVLRYRLVYYASFALLFASLFLLRAICRQLGHGQAGASAAPILFALLLPVLQTRGGYFYDLSEVFFLAAAVAVAIGGWRWLLLPLAALATLNKESFFFFAFALYPFLAMRFRRPQAVIWTLATAGVSGVIYALVHNFYSGNPGVTADLQVLHTLGFYLNPLNLFHVEATYGLPLFKGYGVVAFALFALVAAAGWRDAPPVLRRHLAVAAAINLPLFILFCAEGEMRNLSMLYVAFVVLLSGAVQRWTTPAVR